MEDALFGFNRLRDFYRITALRLKTGANLHGFSRPMIGSGMRLKMLFLRTLCWAFFVVQDSILFTYVVELSLLPQ